LGEDADKKKLEDLTKQIGEEKKLIEQGKRDRDILVKTDYYKRREDAKKEAEAAKKEAEDAAKKEADAAKKAADAARKYAADRLNARRTIRDIEISLIKNDADREIVATQEKYARLITDTKNSETLKKDEKLKLIQLYQQQLEFELGKQEQAEVDAEAIKNLVIEIDKAKK
jgi:colicin import membrane protein